MPELDGFRMGILATGGKKPDEGGSTLYRFGCDILEGKVADQIDISVGAVVCSRLEGGVYSKVAALNKRFGLKGDDKLDVVHIGEGTHPEGPQERGQSLGESAAVCRLFEERGIDFGWMLGWTRKLNGEFIEVHGWKPEYAIGDPNHHGIYHRGATLGNNHPAILPFLADTYGHGAHADAMEFYRQGKIRKTAMTWHLASAEVDGGPVIYEEPVPIYEPIYGMDVVDDLEKRVQDIEKEKTTEVIARHLSVRAEHLRAT